MIREACASEGGVEVETQGDALEPLTKKPTGVVVHGEGRPLLGRKLAGKSQREMRDLGLTVEEGDQGAQAPAVGATP